jgi:hypothetical protein
MVGVNIPLPWELYRKCRYDGRTDTRKVTNFKSVARWAIGLLYLIIITLPITYMLPESLCI